MNYKKPLFFLIIAFAIYFIYFYPQKIWPAPEPFKLDPEYKNICINHKDPSTFNNLEILTEFIKGPCDPLIIVPGDNETR